MGIPSVFPTGTTIYNPEKCWNGYTIMPIKKVGAVLIDMNGNVVKVWKDFQGFPNKLLPGGYCMGSLGLRDSAFSYQDQTDLTQIDWDGNVVWKFDHKEYIEDEGQQPRWMARQHHDYQREGNPVGYYVPGMDCKTDSGNTLILCHSDVYNKRISDKRLLDDTIIEVDWEGNIIWEWNLNKHFNQLSFSEAAKNVLFRNPNVHYTQNGEMSDWMHINSMSVLGPNKWYDQGDERFHKVTSYGLWAIVLFRLLCPVSLQADFSLFALWDTPVTANGTITSSIHYVPAEFAVNDYPQEIMHGENAGDVNSTAGQQAENETINWQKTALLAGTFLWLAGVLAMAVYAAVAYRRLRRKLITASPLRDNIYLADEIASPFVLGLVRPKIYLPSFISPREQEYIILHEQYHIRRFDHLFKALAFLALGIHWFNPLVWVAFILAGKDMEMSCDEAVVRKMGDGILADYTASLLSLATGRTIIAGVPLAFGEGDPKGRIYNLAQWKNRPFWWLARQ